MEKKYQVFISSTYKDLIPERNKVRDAILSMYHFPIGMEMFSAADEEQWEIIKETIDSSDYYVLIIGKRYGSVIPDGPDKGKSYTEKEFQYAKDNGIPILAFIKNDSAITADNVESDAEKLRKLQSFVETVRSGREVNWFNTIDELGMQVTLSLYKQIERKKRPGWVRGDRFDLDASLNELVVLSRRVRELEDENRKLRESAIVRKPELIVTVVDHGTIDEPYDRPDDLDVSSSPCITIERENVNSQSYFGALKRLTLRDVPESVADVVSQDDLDKYNNALPPEDAIHHYDQDMYIYNIIHKNGHLLDFIIENAGNVKAIDVNITLEFPPSFVVMNRSEAEQVSTPAKPKLPQNPIENALQKKKLDSFGQLGKLADAFISANTMSFPGLSAIGGLGASALYSPLAVPGDWSTNSGTWSVDIDGNKVKIWSYDLLHTYSETCDELCVIPKEAGTFIVKVSIMCEEYIEPQESEIEIEVVNK